MVGSNLEDDGENDLSLVTSMETQDEKSQLASEMHDSQYDRIARFNSELGDNGLELPAFFSARTDLQLKPLPDGYYLSTAVISDQRGDSYYSAVIGATVNRGSIGGWSADERFYGRDY